MPHYLQFSVRQFRYILKVTAALELNTRWLTVQRKLLSHLENV